MKEAPERLVLRGAGVESGRSRRRAGHQARHQVVAGRRGVPEEEAPHPLAPGVLSGLRQVHCAAVRGVHSPADSGFPEPGADDRQIRLRQVESHPDRLRPERREHRFRRVARAHEGEQVEQGAGCARIRCPHPGDVKGDPAGRSEHRRDGGAVTGEIRGEHQHVGRLEIRMRVEEAEEPVVQRLRFADRGVADVDLDRVVRFASRGLPLHRLSRRAQLEDVPLQRGEPRRPPWRDEVVAGLRAGVLRIDERVRHVATRPAPGCEKLVADVEVAFGGIDVRGSQPTLARRVDVAPVLPARIEDVDVEVEPLARGVQHLEVGGRQRGHREEAHPSRPSFRRARSESVAEGVDGGDPVTGRPVRGALAFGIDEAPPQAGLPVRRRTERPLANPVRPVQQAAVVDPGQAVGELEAFARPSAREVGAHRSGGGLPFLRGEIGQGVVDAPAQAHRRIGALAPDSGRRAAHDRPGEVGGKLETEIGDDALRARELKRQPARHAPVRHHDSLRFERMAGSGERALCEHARERFEPVRVMEVQHSSHPLGMARSPRA